MKAISICIIIFCLSINAQTELKFVNYGPKASKTEGDDNYIQVINIKLPANYTGNAFLRLYDMSCGSTEDVVIGTWNSRFRFSVYKGELNEDDILRIPNYRAEINKSILGRFEIGRDTRFFGKWSNFVDLNKRPSEDSTYSLIVEGVEGDDGNDFNVFVSSDSLANDSIAGLKLYSYQPTLALKRTDEEMFFKITPNKQDAAINVHTFDMDGTECFFSSLLRNEIPLTQNAQGNWSINKFVITPYESENDCTFDIGSEFHEDNDITFYLDNHEGKKYPILLEPNTKLSSTIPNAQKEFIFTDCNTVNLDLKASGSIELDSLGYRWQFEDGFSSTEKTFKRTFEKSGKYKGEFVVLDETSKAITRATLEKFEILINERPIAVAGNDNVVTPKQKIFFDGSRSSDSDGRIVDYSWNFGDGSVSSGEKVNHEYSAPGKYFVVLKVVDNYSNPACNNSLDTLMVTVNAQPVAVTKERIIGSLNQKLTFDASASMDTDGSITNYNWDFNEFGKKDGAVVEQSFQRPGTYKIKLTIKDNSTAANNEAQKYVTVFINEPPKAIAGIDKVAALNEEVLFDGSKSVDRDGKIIEYTWTFGDGFTSSAPKVFHRFNKPGKYKIVLKVKDNSETDSDVAMDSLHVIVNDKPVAKITNEIYLSDGNANLDASESSDEVGGIAKYIWNFGDGSVLEGKIVNHIYKTAGTYNVILKVVDNYNTSNNFSFDTSKVVINKRPIADAGPDRLVAVNQKLKFSSTNSVDPDGKIVESKWFVDNIYQSNKTDFDYTFDKPGTYLVGLEVTDDFKYPAKGIAFAKIKVNSPPIASIDCIKNVAPKQKIKFDASQSRDIDGSIKDFSWNFGDGTKAIGKTVEKSFENSGVYSVTLIIKDDANVDNSTVTETVFVKVNNSPIVKIDEAVETCGNIVTFDASKSIDPDGDDLTFFWEFPNQPKQKGSAIISHDFSERGILPVTVSIDDGLGLANSISRRTISVKVHQPPVADAGPDTTICAGDILILSGLKSKAFEKGLLQYEWTFDDSIKLSGSNVFRVFKKGGIYSVMLKVTDDSGLPCNGAIDTKIIKILDAPIAVAGEDIVACAAKPIIFDGSKSISPGGLVSSYSWEFGDGEMGVGVNPLHVYAKPGVYKVTLTITGDIKGKCDNTAKDNLNVTITDAPIAAFVSRDSSAENSDCTFDASTSNATNGKIVSYDWNFGDGGILSGQVVKHRFTKYGNYNVILTIKTDLKTECNSSSVTRLIYVNASPVARIIAKTVGSINELLNFDASLSKDADGKIVTYYWNLGDGTIQQGINICHQYYKSGNYLVTLTVSDGTKLENSVNRDSVLLSVKSFPIAKFSIPESIQKNEEIILDATGSIIPEGKIISYEWFMNENKISNEPVVKLIVDQIGKKRIKLIITGSVNQINYFNEAVNYIEVLDYPSVSIPKELVVCQNDHIRINPIVGEDADLYDYVWTKIGSKEQYSTKELNIISTDRNNSTYVLEVFNKRKKIISIDSILVLINNSPKLPLMRDTTIYIGKANDEILFDVSKAIDIDGNHLKVKWNFGDGKFSDEPITFHRYEKEGVYHVEIEADDQTNTNCSKVKTTFQITVKKQF